jgi:hypothetical protein
MLFCEWLHQHTADELLLHNIVWTDEACFTRAGVFSVHNSHLWAQANPHAVRERIKSTSASEFGLESSGTLSWALICYLTAQRYHDFLETVGAAWSFGSSCEAEVVVSAKPALQRTMRKMFGSPGRWIGRRGPIVSSPRSSDLIPMDFFLEGKPERVRLCSPSRGSGRSRGKTSSICDNGRC